MRKRDNLISFRTTEGSAMEKIHQQAKGYGDSIKDIIEGWAEAFAHMSKASDTEEVSDD